MVKTVGFIGLGMMGRGMAKHVLGSGHPVTILVRSNEDELRCADLLAGGAQPLKTAAEVAAAADIVIICVTGSPQVEDGVFAEPGLLHGIKP